MRFVALFVIGACARPTPTTNGSLAVAKDAAVEASPVDAEAAPRIGQPFFVDGGQAMLCEPGSPPVGIERSSPQTSCWYAGASCQGHGAQIADPFTLADHVVSGETVHGGCDRGTYALVYEPHTSPLRLRVCETRPPPIDCPATVHDGARWDVTPLLEANHETRAVLVRP